MSTLRDFFPPVTPATQPFMQVQDQIPTGTHGGASVVGDNHRDLNTVLHNDIVGASLSSNQVTLPAGTYYVEAVVLTMSLMRSGLSLRDSSGTYLLAIPGTYKHSISTQVLMQAGVPLSGQIVLPATEQIKVVSYCEVAATDYGLGANSGDSNVPFEVYTDLRIWQTKEGI